MLRSRASVAAAFGFFVASCSGDAPSGSGGGVSVSITSPATGARFAAGDTIALALEGTASGSALGASALSHWVVFHHATHTHPFLPPVDGAGRQVFIPQEGHIETDIWYRFYARAVDASGRADTAYVDVLPRLASLTLATDPAGLQVTLDGQPRTAPFTFESVVGMHREVGVLPGQSLGGIAYDFFAWSNGGTATQVLTTPATATTLTAALSATGTANVAPVVALISPVAGSVHPAGSPVALLAEATDADGSVTRVQFFDGFSLVGQDLSAPFTLAWTPSSPGPRSLTARATDDAGTITGSAAVSVTVQGTGSGDVVAPAATLTAPLTGITGLTGAVQLAATATDDVGVAAVEFEVDGVLVAEDQSAPYTATLPATSAFTTGAHVLRARARDLAGNHSPWSRAVVTFGGNVDLPAGFSRSTWASGFGSLLTSVAIAPDGRMFVTEQTGALRVVVAGQLLPDPFITLPVLSLGERGLLGVALDPAFASNGYVYVYHTTADGGAHNRISRFTAAGNVAAAGSELILADLLVLSGASNHNGGAMAFGPDGKLYVAVGDNANGSHAPSLATTFGKMLRFDPDGSIPTDNPFHAQTTGLNRAIWARGLRNPYTFAFEPGTGRMLINDVGQSTWEEINLGRAGADYGWPATEGPTTNLAYDAPLFAYRHDQSPTLFTGFSIVGASFYRPATNTFGSDYAGDFFFADYVSGWIYRLDQESNEAYAFARTGGSPVNLITGPEGSLYVLLNGRIDRIWRP